MRHALPILPILAFVAFVPMAACGAHVTVDGSTSGSGGSSASSGSGGSLMAQSGHLEASCAPNDGPATALILDGVSGCTPPSQQVSLVELTFWGPTLANLHSGATLTFTTDFNSGVEGFALVVGAAGQTSTQVTAGSISFDAFIDGTSASGSYDLTFADGSHQQSTFTAGWCPGGGQCG